MKGNKMNRNLKGGFRLREDGTFANPHSQDLSRKGFLKGLGAVGAGVAAAGIGLGGVARAQTTALNDVHVTVEPFGYDPSPLPEEPEPNGFTYWVPNYYYCWDIAYYGESDSPKLVPGTPDIAELFAAVNGLHFRLYGNAYPNGIDFYFTEDLEQGSPYLTLPSGNYSKYNYSLTDKPIVTLAPGEFYFGEINNLDFTPVIMAQDQSFVKLTNADYPLSYFYGLGGIPEATLVFEGDLGYGYAGGLAMLLFTREAEIKGDPYNKPIIRGGYHPFRMDGHKPGSSLWVNGIRFEEPGYSAAIVGYDFCNIYVENVEVFNAWAMLGTANPERFAVFSHNTGKYEVKNCHFDNRANNQMSFISHNPFEVRFVAPNTECTICPSLGNTDSFISGNTVYSGTTFADYPANTIPRGPSSGIFVPLTGIGILGPYPSEPIPIIITNNPMVQADIGIGSLFSNCDFTITNNTVQANSSGMQFIYPTQGTPFGVISGNDISMSNYGMGMFALGMLEGVVSNNKFLGETGVGVYLDDSYGNTFTGNNMASSKPFVTYYFDANTAENIVKGYIGQTAYDISGANYFSGVTMSDVGGIGEQMSKAKQKANQIKSAFENAANKDKQYQ